MAQCRISSADLRDTFTTYNVQCASARACVRAPLHSHAAAIVYIHILY